MTMSRDDIARIFPEMVNHFNAEKAEGIDAAIQFDLSGDNGGLYWLKIADKQATVGEGTCTSSDNSGIYGGADPEEEALVERGVAACVNAIAGVKSTYRWEGRVVTDSEHLLLIKTTSRQYPLLEAAIRELSNYDVPEVIALSIEAGSAAYLDWLAAAVAGKS